eukprot:CAMPEP_0197438308 /NCGR_PEP_ID=MMETSP1175-20131217/5346_1 /TAXON_ID=1003142 /ORGANISM="Triceratium dubium, Strain CCMP147" /LENGTH=133 /DNA_ID=CAMNT_0042968013 /DNA_START=274 /DNA_END=675 /DNA_ORIENTATION=-
MFGNGGARGKGKYRQVPHHDFSDSDSDEADDFISQQVRNQRQQMKEQDEGLEMLSQSADRLGMLSKNIHEELGHQNKLLDEMEEDLDTATTQLDFVTQKTRELIQRSGGKKNFLIIVGLTLVVIVLIILIIYT